MDTLELQAGDHICVRARRGAVPYEHHGIYVGPDRVIHLCPRAGTRVAIRDSGEHFAVRSSSLDSFARGATIRVIRHPNGLDPQQVVATAESLLGVRGYDLLDGNCEHFATYCATGQWHSHQIMVSEAVVENAVSAATKTAWVIAQKTMARTILRSPARFHPALIVADLVAGGVAIAGCSRGLPANQIRRVADGAGALTAAALGGLLGGPGGAAAGVAVHAASNRVASITRHTLRSLWRCSSTRFPPATDDPGYR
ncbi:MAG: hypothetical protein D6753_18570 [Planctomycetota bacterium]|nr:MAG: hypothetical protein D6753_18570 [Planctomycetota bacterium]